MPIVIIDDTLSEVEQKDAPVECDLAVVYKHAAVMNPDAGQKYGRDRKNILVEGSELVSQNIKEPLIVAGPTKNQLYNAIIHAYNNHLGLTLHPDNILHCFSAVVSQCLNDHAEKYRDIMVSHDGQIMLKTKTAHGDWIAVIKQFSQLIDANSKSTLDLSSDFSNSTETTKMVASIVKMATFSQYYMYWSEMECGIRKVNMTGELADWVNLKEKCLKCLDIFNKRGDMINWGKHFITIIDRLIETYQSKQLSPKLQKFWSRIVTFVPFGSGHQNYISGWSKVLFPGYNYNGINDKTEYPAVLNILEDNDPPTTSYFRGYRKYQDQDRIKEWMQLCDQLYPESLVLVQGELLANDVKYNMYFTAGHLGWKITDGFTEASLGYVVHVKKL